MYVVKIERCKTSKRRQIDNSIIKEIHLFGACEKDGRDVKILCLEVRWITEKMTENEGGVVVVAYIGSWRESRAKFGTIRLRRFHRARARGLSSPMSASQKEQTLVDRLGA
jgi:hypothetical protein